MDFRRKRWYLGILLGMCLLAGITGCGTPDGSVNPEAEEESERVENGSGISGEAEGWHLVEVESPVAGGEFPMRDEGENSDLVEAEAQDAGEERLTGEGTDSDSEARPSTVPDWSGVTADGVDEAVFLEHLDIALLEEIAEEFQALATEEAEAEREYPEIVLAEGWVRVFESERYRRVLELGESAMEPLYYILYKSEGNGLYEYLCAEALYELSGYDFESADGAYREWSTPKQFLERFTEELTKP